MSRLHIILSFGELDAISNETKDKRKQILITLSIVY